MVSLKLCKFVKLICAWTGGSALKVNNTTINNVLANWCFIIGISHLIVCPRPAWAVFQDFDSRLHCCKYFSSFFSVPALSFLFRGSAGTQTRHCKKIKCWGQDSRRWIVLPSPPEVHRVKFFRPRKFAAYAGASAPDERPP